LDHLISNAGVSSSGPLKTFDELYVSVFKYCLVNVDHLCDLMCHTRDAHELVEEVKFPITSLLLLVRGFLPLIQKSQVKKILVVTSVVGSITLAPLTANLGNGYGIARAALNMYVLLLPN
jgi:NAD(P)-dependent dehydrogenase (short-subunit alcohol dehydrogenase family)